MGDRSPPPTAAPNIAAVIASLVETAKLNSVEPHAYLADVMTRIISGHPNSRIE